jgi:hypothetical protein
MFRILTACLLVGLTAVSVSAQSTQPKLTSTALTWSIGATLVPAAVGGALVLHSTKGMGTDENEAVIGIVIGSLGLLFGPGTGHAYAGRERPMEGAYIRGFGMLVGGLLGLGAGVAISFGNDVSPVAIGIIAGSGLVVLGSAIYDTATVGRSVNKYNDKHGFARVGFQPWFHASKEAIGLAVNIRL